MKDAYWFRHDANGRHDHKMIALRAKYGSAGYGAFWMFIETLRETDGYLFPKKHLLSLCLDFGYKELDALVADCVTEFELLEESDDYVWSPSLMKRMKKFEELKEIRATAGQKGGLSKQTESKPKAKVKQTGSKHQATREEKTREEKILRTENGTALTTVVLEAMKSKYGEFSNYPVESKKAQHIVERAKTLYPERIEDFITAMLGCFWKQTQTAGSLKGKAFTPSTLDTEWIWNETYEALRRDHKNTDSVIKEKIF